MSARQNMPMQMGMGRGMHYLLPAQIHAGVKMNTGLMHQQIGMMQTGQQSHQFLLNDILNTTQTILQQQKEHHEQQNFNQQRILLPFFNDLLKTYQREQILGLKELFEEQKVLAEQQKSILEASRIVIRQQKELMDRMGHLEGSEKNDPVQVRVATNNQGDTTGEVELRDGMGNLEGSEEAVQVATNNQGDTTGEVIVRDGMGNLEPSEKLVQVATNNQGNTTGEAELRDLMGNLEPSEKLVQVRVTTKNKGVTTGEAIVRHRMGHLEESDNVAQVVTNNQGVTTGEAIVRHRMGHLEGSDNVVQVAVNNQDGTAGKAELSRKRKLVVVWTSDEDGDEEEEALINEIEGSINEEWDEIRYLSHYGNELGHKSNGGLKRRLREVRGRQSDKKSRNPEPNLCEVRDRSDKKSRNPDPNSRKVEGRQSPEKSRKGEKVAKVFQPLGVFQGMVENEWENAEGKIIYRIKYEDSDSEDMSEDELEEAICYHKYLKDIRSASASASTSAQKTTPSTPQTNQNMRRRSSLQNTVPPDDVQNETENDNGDPSNSKTNQETMTMSTERPPEHDKHYEELDEEPEAAAQERGEQAGQNTSRKKARGDHEDESVSTSLGTVPDNIFFRIAQFSHANSLCGMAKLCREVGGVSKELRRKCHQTLTAVPLDINMVEINTQRRRRYMLPALLWVKERRAKLLSLSVFCSVGDYGIVAQVLRDCDVLPIEELSIQNQSSSIVREYWYDVLHHPHLPPPKSWRAMAIECGIQVDLIDSPSTYESLLSTIVEHAASLKKLRISEDCQSVPSYDFLTRLESLEELKLGINNDRWLEEHTDRLGNAISAMTHLKKLTLLGNWIRVANFYWVKSDTLEEINVVGMRKGQWFNDVICPSLKLFESKAYALGGNGIRPGVIPKARTWDAAELQAISIQPGAHLACSLPCQGVQVPDSCIFKFED